jgi:hypothetical protein
LITGSWPSFTVTVKEQVAVLPAASFTVYVIVVTPVPVVPLKPKALVPTKLIPVDGEEADVAPVITQVNCVTAQLSAVPGFGTAIVATQALASVFLTILTGQLIVGFSASTTVTVNVQLATPQLFVAVAVTVVVPTGKKVPDACE